MGTIRTLLAIAVVAAHTSWPGGTWFVGPSNAVQLFYMISGFLISYILTEAKSYPTAGSFYLNRALRLYPIYFVVLLITLAAIYVGGAETVLSTIARAPPEAKVLLVASNTILFGQDWVMFMAVEQDHLVFSTNFTVTDVNLYQGLLVPQAWTLGVEISFYLVAPFVLRRPYWIAGLLAASVALRCYLFAIGLGEKDPWTYRFFPTELALFLLGAIAHQVLLPAFRRISIGHQPLLAHMGTAALILLVVGYPFLPGDGWLKSYTLFAVALLLLPASFVFQQGSKVDAWIGNLSYPIYIGHMLIVWSSTRVLAAASLDSSYAPRIFVVVVTFAFALVLHFAVGRPVERLRKLVRDSTPRAASIPTSAVS